VVVSRSVDVGQTVAASLQAPTLFVIANDLTAMQVVANVDEADIGQIGPDASVVFTVDSFPGETFQGQIDQIRLNPLVTQNVVTYSVIVNVPNPDLKLRPGMTANTTFTIAESDDALRLPNAALRFWPASEPREKERSLIAEFTMKQADHRGPGGHGEASASASQDGPAAQADGDVLRFPKVRRAPWHPRVVWISDGAGAPEPRVVRVGITDGTSSQIKEGDLPEGSFVITGTLETAASAQRPATPNPFNPLGARPSMKGGGGRRP